MLANKFFINLVIYLLFVSSAIVLMGAEDNEVITAIILINRNAELVDVNSEGIILQRYIAVPDYFSSRKSHKILFSRSMKRSRKLSYQDHFLPNRSSVPAKCLQKFMVSSSTPSKKSMTCIDFDRNETFDLSSIESEIQFSQIKARHATIRREGVDKRRNIGQGMYIVHRKKVKSSVYRYNSVSKVLDVSSIKKREPLRRRIV